MQRKQFLLTTMAAMPALAFAKGASNSANTKDPFIVKAGNNRSGEPMMKFMGMHPNDVIISRKDTGNALSVFLFTDTEMWARLCTCILTRTNFLRS